MGSPMVSVGSLAPDFDLPCTPRFDTGAATVSLADFRGKWLLLVFYPRDFSLVCPTELTALSARIDDFRRQGCEIVGVSSDSVESHLRWIATPVSQGGVHGLAFPLASDTDGQASRAYGVFLEQQRLALRGLFLIDPNGVLQYQLVHNLSVGRRTDEILRVLEALQTGGLCAESWQPGQPTLRSPAASAPGRMVSHYRLEKEVGSGAFSRVFRAHDTTLDRTVALKIMKPDSPLPVGSVLAEARAAASLNDPHVCTIYSVDEADGVPVIAMEYLSGKPLSKLITHGEPLPLNQAIDIARQVAQGMATAHVQGVVHGDLKPANLFVTNDGVVKILDFGLARRDQPEHDPDETTDLEFNRAGGVTGTPSYMSPEQAEGLRPTAASDVFSLGAILYEMVTGQQAFVGKNVLQVLGRIRNVDAERLTAALPEPLARLLREMLTRACRLRTISMAEVAARLVANESAAVETTAG
ncbi:MAG TPA: redoxin domain-containing protein [Pirellulales bacterium]|nr:redoxin domain-containing protein [Pirellulales bacterium]